MYVSANVILDKEINPYKLVTRRIDSNKIRLGQKKDIKVHISSAHELNFIRDNPGRSGAIIYTNINGRTLFCLGIDTESGDLTDFGGGVKKDETRIEGGLRELHEESQGIFGNLTPYNVRNSITFHSHNMAIMFLNMDVDPIEIETKFQNKINVNPCPEVSGIVWLTTRELLESIHGRGHKLYVRVRKLLSKVTNVISDL